MAALPRQSEGPKGNERSLADFTKELNTWLSCSTVPEKSTSQRLADILYAVDVSPHARRYKQCEDGHTKFRFLWAVASVIRAVREYGPISARVQSHQGVVETAQRLEKAFFDFSSEVPPLGIVLSVWHTGRLERYNETLWRAAQRITNRLKHELQGRLVGVLRHAAKNRPRVELELQKWPMAGCPLARAFLEFLVQHSGELGDLGRPALSECPPHSLLPRTLRKLLGLLEAFEFEEDRTGRASGAVGIVRLRVEGGQAHADKAVGTKPKASSGQPPGHRRQATEAARPSLPNVSPRTRMPPLPPPPPPRPSRAAAAPSTQPKAPARKLVRRRIDWGNDLSMRRIVRRGLSAQDPEWAASWTTFCRGKQISPKALAKTTNAAPEEKEAIAEFVEEHLAMLMKKDWAKDLLFKAEGQDDELPPDSADEDGADRRVASVLPRRPMATPSLSAGAVAATAKSGRGAAPAVGPSAPGVKRPATDRRPPGSPASVSPATSDDPRGSAEAASSSRAGMAAPGAEGAEYSSGSESSRSRKRKKMKHKKKKGMKYGKYMNQMMSQMMGMSMMMNNPLLASMGMNMPGMSMLANARKKSRKDDNATKVGGGGLEDQGLKRRMGDHAAGRGLGPRRRRVSEADAGGADNAINTDEL